VGEPARMHVSSPRVDTRGLDRAKPKGQACGWSKSEGLASAFMLIKQTPYDAIKAFVF